VVHVRAVGAAWRRVVDRGDAAEPFDALDPAAGRGDCRLMVSFKRNAERCVVFAEVVDEEFRAAFPWRSPPGCLMRRFGLESRFAWLVGLLEARFRLASGGLGALLNGAPAVGVGFGPFPVPPRPGAGLLGTTPTRCSLGRPASAYFGSFRSVYRQSRANARRKNGSP
jgi:hypothetical protein